MYEAWLILHYVWTYGGDIAVVLCTAAAFRWGGRVERWGAGIYFVGGLLSFAVAHLRLEKVEGPHLLIMVIDVAVLLAFARLSLWSRRPWTLVLTAFQFNDVMIYPAAYLSHMDTFTFLTALGFWGGWALLAVLTWAIWDHARRQRSVSSAPA